MTTTTATTLHCPSWCDGDHKDDVHRSVLWTDENFDMKRVKVSLINFEEVMGNDYSGVPEIALTVVDPEDEAHHSVELWLSFAMVGELVQQLTHALVMAAVETDEANR